jgi:hypothetical protein
VRTSWSVIIGWIVELVGTAFWLYGYYATGHQSIINWHAHAPWWIANFLPNIESEIGMALVFGGMIPMYWLPRRKAQARPNAPLEAKER